MTRAPFPIAFCITDLDRGGAEQALVQIVTRLDHEEWLPQVICLSGEGELAGPLRDAGVPVTCLNAKRWWDLRAVLRLRRELKRIRPVLLQTFLYHANILGRTAGRMARVPVIVSGIRVAERRSRFRLWLDRTTERWVARHVCVSEGVAEFSIETGGLSKEKVAVIPNGVDFDRFSQAQRAELSPLGIKPTDRVVIFVGRLDRQKGISTLLEAFRDLCGDSAYPDSHLLLVGEGPLRGEIEGFVRKERLESRLHVLGRRDDVPALLKSADCLVLPSLWEGMPNVVLESMAAGIPVIASNVEGTRELIRHNATGLLTRAGDPSELATAIRRVLSDREYATGLALRAQQFISQRVTWGMVTASYADLYRDLLA